MINAISATMSKVFESVAEAHDEQDPTLHIEAREIRAVRRAGGVAWFDLLEMVGQLCLIR